MGIDSNTNIYWREEDEHFIERAKALYEGEIDEEEFFQQEDFEKELDEQRHSNNN